MGCYGTGGGALLHNGQLHYLMQGRLCWEQSAAVVVVSRKLSITVQHDAREGKDVLHPRVSECMCVCSFFFKHLFHTAWKSIWWASGSSKHMHDTFFFSSSSWSCVPGRDSNVKQLFMKISDHVHRFPSGWYYNYICSVLKRFVI